jgi:hypothetical protein
MSDGNKPRDGRRAIERRLSVDNSLSSKQTKKVLKDRGDKDKEDEVKLRANTVSWQCLLTEALYISTAPHASQSRT